MLEQLAAINSSKWMAGCSMLLLNIGARYVQADLGKTHDLILSNAYFKKVIVFALFFVATRDIVIAFMLTIVYIFVIDGLLHEDRKFCIVPKCFIPPAKSPKKEDYEKAKDIVKKYESFQNPSPDIYLKYLSTLALLPK